MPTYILISEKKGPAVTLLRKSQPQAGATLCRVGAQIRRSGVVFEATESEVKEAAPSVPKHARLVECDASGAPKKTEVEQPPSDALALYALLRQEGVDPEDPSDVRAYVQGLIDQQSKSDAAEFLRRSADEPAGQKVEGAKPDDDAPFEVNAQLLDGGGYRTVLAVAKALDLGEGSTKAEAAELLEQFGENPAFKAQLAASFEG